MTAVKNKSQAPIQNIIASVLSGQYAYSNGLESITQATGSFSAGLAGLAPNGGDNPNAPSAYLNYILFDTNYARVAAGAVQVPQAAGFEEPQRGNGYSANNLLKFDRAISVSQTGYLYIWVSNESENTEVWFDDLNVIHQKTLVAEATDYGVWGDVMREQKWEDLEGKYRWGMQGQYSELDKETSWNHFELREYDPIRGQWTSMDPYGQYFSPYVGMGNNPVNGVDPDGGLFGKWRAERWARANGGKSYYDKETKSWWAEAGAKEGAGVRAKDFGAQGLGLGLLSDGKSFHVETEVTFGGQIGVEVDNLVEIEANLASFRLFGNDKILNNQVLSVLHHDYDTNKDAWLKNNGFEVKNSAGIKVLGFGIGVESSQNLINRGSEIVSKNWQRNIVTHRGLVFKKEKNTRTDEVKESKEFTLGAKVFIGVELKISYK